MSWRRDKPASSGVTGSPPKYQRTDDRDNSQQCSRGRGRRGRGRGGRGGRSKRDSSSGAPSKKILDEPRVDGVHLSEVEFNSLSITSASKRSISEVLGFKKLTEVQAATLPLILAGYDVCAKARTGTGKTMGFLLPCVESIAKDTSSGLGFSVLILSPTRELALQIAKEAESLVKFHEHVTITCVMGGVPINREKTLLKSRVDILVATPGRLQDHMENTPGIAHRMQSVKFLVLDEADLLLEVGFQKEILKIIDCLPAREVRQTLLFSATIPKSVQKISKLALKEGYKFVDVIGDANSMTNVQVTQTVAFVELKDHISALEGILRTHIQSTGGYKIIVFCITARVTAFLAGLFRSMSYNVLDIHSRKSQSSRTNISNKFRDASNVILFSSDVSARGVDYPGVSLIVQLGATEREQYIHRLGRTARAGRQGQGILLLAPFERAVFQKLKGIPVTDITKEVNDSLTHSAELDRAISNVKSDSELTKQGELAYSSYLGFYATNKTVKLGNDRTVSISNEYAGIIGLNSLPQIKKSTVSKMGLKGVSGLNILKGC